MDGMSSLWSYPELSFEDLKQRLLLTTLELQSVRDKVNEEKNKNKEYIMQLHQLVKIVCKERDEAKDQLQKLLLPNSPTVKLTKANSGLTECNSLSDTYNYHSHTSSPTTSFFEAASSPDLLNLKQPFVKDCHDEGSLVIEKLAEGRSLPEKGKLLQAVLDAGPLLRTVMVAGPLPQWRNPPPHQPLEVPPFCVGKGLDMSLLPKFPDSSFSGFNCGSSQMMSPSSVVNFGSEAYGYALNSNFTNYGFNGKRQRLK